MEQIFNVTVNGSFKFNLKESDLANLNMINIDKNRYHLIHNHKSCQINLEKSDFNQRQYQLEIDNNHYQVSIQNNLDQLIQDIGISLGNSKKSNNIKAPMPGLILSLNVKPGQTVNEGDVLLILEAMKMENTIISPKNGVVKSINISKGNTVEKGQLMIELEDE